jgi:3-dehydroquinate synthetase
VAVKIEVIQKDPYERGPRAALNLGHTIGHAIETLSNYRLRHGEAVAIGMVAEARIAEHLGIAEAGLSVTIADVLRRHHLPTEIPMEYSGVEILNAMRVDKKRSGGSVRFALPVRIGEVRTGIRVDDVDTLLEAV